MTVNNYHKIRNLSIWTRIWERSRAFYSLDKVLDQSDGVWWNCTMECSTNQRFPSSLGSEPHRDRIFHVDQADLRQPHAANNEMRFIILFQVVSFHDFKKIPWYPRNLSPDPVIETCWRTQTSSCVTARFDKSVETCRDLLPSRLLSLLTSAELDRARRWQSDRMSDLRITVPC